MNQDKNKQKFDPNEEKKDHNEEKEEKSFSLNFVKDDQDEDHNHENEDDLLDEEDDLLDEEDNLLDEEDDLLDEEDDLLDEEDDLLYKKDDLLYKKDDLLDEEDDILDEEDDILDEEDDILDGEDDPLDEENDLLYKKDDPLDEENDLLYKKDDPLDEENDLLYKKDDLLDEEDAILNEEDDLRPEEDDIIAKANKILEADNDLTEEESTGYQDGYDFDDDDLDDEDDDLTEEESTDYEDDDLDDEKNDLNNKRKNWIFSGLNEEDSSRPVDYKKFTRDLTKEAHEGQLDPVIGREKEIKRLIQILSRRTKNNPVITGEPGVGKTAVVEGLAQRIASYDVPDNLISSRIIMLDIGALIAGTRYRGEFEERLRFIIDKVQKSPKRILFIDEIHTLIGAGSAEGTMDAANMLKPVLARGNFRCIGATTTKEYKRYIERDPALERRFQPVVVDPPSVVDTVVILAGLRRSYEGFHDVLITNEALLAAAKYSDQYVPDRFLPDKAIDVIDEACAQVKLEAVSTSESIKAYTRELNRLLLEKDKLIRQQNYYMAAKIYEKEKQIRTLIKSNTKTLQKNKKLT